MERLISRRAILVIHALIKFMTTSSLLLYSKEPENYQEMSTLKKGIGGVIKSRTSHLKESE
jgi:hypothetical protein